MLRDLERARDRNEGPSSRLSQPRWEELDETFNTRDISCSTPRVTPLRAIPCSLEDVACTLPVKNVRGHKKDDLTGIVEIRQECSPDGGIEEPALERSRADDR